MLSNIMVEQDGVIYVQNQKFAVAEGDLYRYKGRLMQKRDLVQWLPLSSVLHLLPAEGIWGTEEFLQHYAPKSVYYAVGWACVFGLRDVCKALKLDTSWYERYWDMRPINAPDWKRRHVLPIFLERLYETP